MEEYSIFTDFENYIAENQALISYLHENKSLLDDYISPILKTLTFLKKQETIKDRDEIFEFGFNFLFENIEQIKMYLRQLNNDYAMLEKLSLYIKMIFNLEELRLELEKNNDLSPSEKKKDIVSIEEALDFFEEHIIPNITINEYELDKYVNLYYELIDRHQDIVLMTDVFEQYCATYGI